MNFVHWIAGGFLICAVAFAAIALGAPYVDDIPLTPPTLLLAAGYCLLCVILLGKSQGVQRMVMLMASVAILVAYVFRLLVLIFDEGAFQFLHLVEFTSDAVQRALWFMVAGTIALWLGARTAMKAQRSKVIAQDDSVPRLLTYRAHLITIGLIVGSIVLAINVKFGVQWIGGEGAFLTRFLPIGILPFILMHIAMMHWKAFTFVEKIGVVVFFVILFVSGVAVGSRTAPFSAILPWLTAIIIVLRSPKIPIKSIAAIGLLSVILLPGILGYISIVRDLVRGEGIQKGDLMTFKDIPLLELWGMSGLDLQVAFRLVTDRAGSFDMLTVVANYKPSGIESHLRLQNLIAAAFDGLVPDRIWSSGATPTGTLVSVFYQGLPWSVPHHGAFSGFGFFYVYFGPILGVVALALFGMLVATTLSTLLNGSALVQLWATSFLYNIVFLGFVSGNFDLIIPDLLMQGVIMSGLLWLILMARAAARAQYRHSLSPVM